MLSSEVSSFLHVSVCNYKNLLEVRIRISRQACSWVFVSGQVWGKTALFYFLHVLREGFFILFGSECQDCGKKGKPSSVSTVMQNHRVFGSVPRWGSSKGSARYITQLYVSHITQGDPI